MRARPCWRSMIGLLVFVFVWTGPISVLAAAEPMPSEHAIRLYLKKLQRNPSDAGSYHGLGDAYIQRARETGDLTYLGRAEEALRRAFESDPRKAGALRHLAYVFFFRHEFDAAATTAAKAIDLDPTDPHAYGVLGDAYLEVGKYDQAAEAYERMAQLDASLYSYGRLSGLKSLRGDVRGAIADLERAIQSGKATGRPRESIAWAEWQLGTEHLNVGDLTAAEAAYQSALTTYPGYHRAVAGLAQVRAAQRRYPETIDLYEKAIAIIPQPDYVAGLGDILSKVGRPEDARKQYDLVEYIGRLNALNKVVYNRELAYFYADHDIKLADALDLARRELEVRRDIYAYDLLAWALYKNGKPEEARAAMVEALKLGTRDARLFFHAGMIEHHLGHTEAARNHLRRALATNRHFHVLHAEEAERVLRELGPGVGDAQ